LNPRTSKSASVAVRRGMFEGQTSVFVPFKECKELNSSLISSYADCIGAAGFQSLFKTTLYISVLSGVTPKASSSRINNVLIGPSWEAMVWR